MFYLMSLKNLKLKSPSLPVISIYSLAGLWSR